MYKMTLDEWVAEMHRFPSVYGASCLEIISTSRIGPFIIRTENVDNTVLDVAYYLGTYIGDREEAEFLYSKGITEHVSHGTGFNPSKQRWYGWSHRAFAGFGVGDSCRLGDCAFEPANKEDIEACMLEFWDLSDPYAWRECENETVVCKNRLFRSVETRQDGVLGWLVAFDTVFIGAPSRYSIHTYFTPYPKVWGKGAYTVRSLKEAKQMAIDFAKGVS